MTTGETLLNLTIEYQASLTAREYGMGEPTGREPSVIAAEYEAAITELLPR